MEPKAYPLEVVLHSPSLNLPGERRSQIAKEDARMPARLLYRQFTFSLPAADSLQTGHVVGCFLLRLPRTEFQLALSLRKLRARHRQAGTASRCRSGLHHTAALRSSRLSDLLQGQCVQES